ncbi:MAG: hypothetical protein IT342_14575 [Candidatus Melainabacteria bacterium]|jgi:hypothetical protein|nr:hypothetical protein [Candidatus Melainabacteria bacterium]
MPSEAINVLKRSIKTYALVETYQDQGNVKTTYRAGTAQEYSLSADFRTFFKRPHYVSFEFNYKNFEDSTSKFQFRFWSDGNYFFVKLPEEDPLKLEEFAPSNEIFSNVTSAPPPVLSLLFGVVNVANFLEISDYGIDYLQGDSCNVVGSEVVGALYPCQNSLWISDNTLMIRKFRKQFILDLARTDLWNRERLSDAKGVSKDFENHVELYKKRSIEFANQRIPDNQFEQSLARLSNNHVIEETIYNSIILNQPIAKSQFDLQAS